MIRGMRLLSSFRMSIPTLAILTLALVGSELSATQAIAQSSPPETKAEPVSANFPQTTITKRDRSKDLNSLLFAPLHSLTSEAQQLGGTIQLSNREELLAPDFEGSYITEVRIRFVNGKGETSDRQGRPITGRIPEDFIRSELQLKPGDTYRQATVRRDLQQLRQLGLFDNVTVAVEPVGTDVAVIYNVNERSPRSISLGGGFSDDVGVFATLGYTDRTVGHLPQRLELSIEPSLREFQYDVAFISPYSAGQDNLGYSIRTFRDRRTSEIFDKDITLANGQDVREIRMGGNLRFTRPLGNWFTTLGLNYTHISTRDRDLNIALRDERGNPLTWSGKGVDELYTVSLSASRDWRNNPFNPTSGSILTLSSEQSIPLGRGNIVMNRLLANYVQYVPIHWIGGGEPTNLPEMFAFNLQAGTVMGDLPPEEAFRLGGRNSVRGYEAGGLGTGRSYVLASGEYRFPLGSDVGGVLFADFASDLGSGKTVLGKPALVRDKPGSGFGGGLGVRVRSPFGLIRLDFGISDRGESQLILTTGQRF